MSALLEAMTEGEKKELSEMLRAVKRLQRDAQKASLAFDDRVEELLSAYGIY